MRMQKELTSDEEGPTKKELLFRSKIQEAACCMIPFT